MIKINPSAEQKISQLDAQVSNDSHANLFLNYVTLTKENDAFVQTCPWQASNFNRSVPSRMFQCDGGLRLAVSGSVNLVRLYIETHIKLGRGNAYTRTACSIEHIYVRREIKTWDPMPVTKCSLLTPACFVRNIEGPKMTGMRRVWAIIIHSLIIAH